MRIIINNRSFDFNTGCKLLKLKYKEPIKGLEDIWDDIIPMTFAEILAMENIEDRRVGIDCLGLERLHEEVNAELVDKQVIKKTTTWVLENGELETVTYDDVYELYKIDKSVFLSSSDRRSFESDKYYVCFKDTSTNRKYLLWVDIVSVNATNNRYYSQEMKTDAIEAIAWTITTDIPKGQIEEIIRQGDCVLIKPKEGYNRLSTFRHLTKDEYLNLLTKES